MSTSGLSSQLQDYLKKSNTENSSSSSLLQNPLSGKFGWFAAKNTSLQPQKEEEATVNGWFSEAQKDPILPSLVSSCLLERSAYRTRQEKTTESDRHPNPTTNPNPNPYLVAVRYGSLAFERHCF